MYSYCDDCYKKVGVFHNGEKDQCKTNLERFATANQNESSSKTVDERLKIIEHRLTKFDHLINRETCRIDNVYDADTVDKKIEKLELNVSNIINALIEENQVGSSSSGSKRKFSKIVCVSSSESEDQVKRPLKSKLTNLIASTENSSSTDSEDSDDSEEYEPSMRSKTSNRSSNTRRPSKRTKISAPNHKKEYFDGLDLKVIKGLTGPKRTLRPRVKRE